MKIGIFFRSSINFAHKDPDITPMPGSETAVLRIAKALKNCGHSVYVITEPSLLKNMTELDVLVVKRNPVISVMYPDVAKQHFFWSPDLTSELSFLPLLNNEFKQRFLKETQKIIAISVYQAGLFRKIGIPKEKIYVSRNGIEMMNFTQRVSRNMRQCVFASTYCDGIEYLKPIWKMVLRKVPKATLVIIAARSLYGFGTNSYIRSELAALNKLPGVIVKHSMSQLKLAKELMVSSVYLYPNTLPETSSILTIEARMAGCIVVTSYRGALPESAAGNVLLRGNPQSFEYQRRAADYIIDIFRNNLKYEIVRNQNMAQRCYYNWMTIAQEWEKLFLEKTEKLLQ